MDLVMDLQLSLLGGLMDLWRRHRRRPHCFLVVDPVMDLH